MCVSLIHGGSSFTGGGGQRSVALLIEFDVEGVLPVEGVGFVEEPEVCVEQSEDESASPDEQPGVLVVEFVVEVGHFVGVPLGVVLVRGVEDEPLADLEHRRQHIHVLLVRQLEVLRTDRGALRELLGQRHATQDVPHVYYYRCFGVESYSFAQEGAGKGEEGRDWAEWEIERSNDLYSETLLIYVYFGKSKPLLSILRCLCFLNFILYWHIVYKCH